MSKPKVAFYWCASCGGCEEAVVDLNEVVLDVVDAVDIVFWPVALDFKASDVEALADGELAASFINGAIRTSEQREMVELLRRKSGAVVAFGACAWLGGIPGLANLVTRESLLGYVYHGSPSTDGDGAEPREEVEVPEGILRLPRFDPDVRTLDQVIDVDYYLPGCPPPADLIVQAVMALVEGRLPEKGTVLAPDVALCAECPRADTKPEDLKVERFHRPYEIVADPKTCLLAQGLLCLGPATRSGCGAVCVAANMPCTGCMGPTSRVIDHGAKALSAIASLMPSREREDVAASAEQIVDPVGTFYRYSLPASLLHRRVDRSPEPQEVTS
ncbi:MAG TPA: oxidoreductase [Actinomycetota bacterium]|jgi:F420-non-reducing hydrogenase small subunit|nr:oxidoreductase [Actinomycetota bacterium]